MTVPAAGGWAAFVAARTHAIASLRGRVLEIGAGEGANFGAMADGVTWVGLEPRRRSRERLAAVARRHGHTAAPLAAVAEDIPLPDRSVDAVLGTAVLCSVRDPALALREILRVLVPGGRLVLAEHVAAPAGSRVRTLQGAVRPLTRLLDHGCDPTRDTEAAVAAGGLRLDHVDHVDVAVLGPLVVPHVVLQAHRLQR